MKVFLVTFSTAVKQHHLDDALLKCAGMNLEPKFHKNILSNWNGFAGTPVDRVEQLKAALESDCEVIFAMRGGDGAIQMLPEIERQGLIISKPIVGYSDLTILQNYSYMKTGIINYHGPNMIKEPTLASVLSQKRALAGANLVYTVHNKHVLVRGDAKGIAVGGNLALLIRSLGTPFEIETRGGIIFIEATLKYSKWIYDSLTQLKLAGKFDNCKAVVLGSFIRCKGHKVMIDTFFKDFDKPVIHWPYFGHGKHNHTILIGAKCEIKGNTITLSQ